MQFKENVLIYTKGAAETFNLQIKKRDDDNSDLEAVDLTNIDSVTLIVKDKKNGTEQFTISGTVSDASNGIVTFNIAASDTESLTAGTYYYVFKIDFDTTPDEIYYWPDGGGLFMLLENV